MLSWVEHETSFITSMSGHFVGFVMQQLIHVLETYIYRALYNSLKLHSL